MTYSTLLALLLASPQADSLPPLLRKLLPSLQQFVLLLEHFHSQPVTPVATHAFEHRLAELLQHLGLEICDWTFNHLEAEDPQGMPQRLEVDGHRYRCRQRSPNTIATLFGPVRLVRYLYENLEPGNPCLFPLENRLGLVAGAASPAFAERASWWLAQHPQGGTLQILQRDHGVHWSVATLRHVTAAFAGGLEEHRQETQVQRVLDLLKKAAKGKGPYRPALVLGRDGIFLPMRAEAYQEGATATLSVYNRRGRRLGTVYLGQMPQPGQSTLSSQLTLLLEETLRQWRGTLPQLGYTTDNGHHPASYYHDVLARLSHPRTGERLTWSRFVDFYHAAGYVQQLATALFGDTKKGTKWARRMRRRLKEKDGVKRILQAATYYAQTRGLKKKRQQAYDKAYGYLRSNGRWMDYAGGQRQGLPIGSGVTEAACKTVFTQRFKQSGMRWEVASGQVVVTLRVVLLSKVWSKTVASLLTSQLFPWPGVQQTKQPVTLVKVA